MLKRLYSWLVSVEHKLEPSEDPTHRRLSAPKGEPGPDCSFPPEHFALSLKHMVGQWRDLLIVMDAGDEDEGQPGINVRDI